MKKEFKLLSWFVTYYNINSRKIEYYNILKYKENFIKKLKKECNTKEEFAEKMRRKMMCYYWCRSEWELIIEIDNNNHIWLIPWMSCKEPENVRIDVTDREDFNWKGFAKEHIDKQIFKNKAKIDVFDQLEWKWNEFIDYCWHTHLRYERNNPKFYRKEDNNL